MRASSAESMVGLPIGAALSSCVLGPTKTGADALLNHRPLELREYAHHLEHGLAGWRRCLEPLLMQVKVDLERMDRGDSLTDIARTYGVAHTTIMRLQQ